MRRVVLLALVVFSTANVFAQQARMSWLRYYQVQPGKEADFLQFINGTSKAAFDQMVAEKKALRWGVAVPLTHNDEPWTHLVFVALADWSAADALVKSMEASDAAMARADQVKYAALKSSSVQPHSVRDVILRHVSTSDAPAPQAQPKYIGLETYVVKPGRAGDAVALFNEWMKPVFNATMAKGKFGPWGFSTQDSAGGYTHVAWYFMNDLGALDENESAMTAMEPAKLRGFDVRLRDLSEPEKHRSQILRIVQ